MLALIAAPGAGAAPFAYVSYSTAGGGKVSVIDAAPNAVCSVAGQTPPCIVRTLQVGASPAGVAANPAGTFAYVANAGDNSVSVIRTSHNPSDITVMTSIQVGFGPWGVAVSPDNAKVYVGLSDGSVAVIDVNNSNAVATIGNVGGMLNGIVAAGSRVYVGDATNSQVVVIDGPTQSVIRRIDVGSPPNSNPMGLVANPSGTRVYVTDLRFDSAFLIDVLEVSAIDTALVDDQTKNPVVAALVIDPYPLTGSPPPDNTLATPGGIAMSPDGSRLYVTNDALDDVTIITLSDGSRAHVSVGTSPVGIATDPTGRAFVANRDGGTVSVLDPFTNAVVKNVDLGGMPFVFGAFATAGPPPPAQFALTLMTVGGGTITPKPAPVAGKYDAGTVVTLTATPDAGSQFTSWSGACSGTSTTCTVTMDAAKSVTATFTPQYSLFVTTLGSGTVSAQPASTSWKYLAGTAVTLTATADPGFVFTSWSGACSGSNATCVVTMDVTKSVTATFTAQYSLFLTTLGSGTVSVSPASPTWKYLAGTAVTLTAWPASDSLFSGWSGACSGTAATCNVTMDAAKSVTATFALKQYPLTLSTVGAGTITANPTSTGGMYPYGTPVSLTATPAANTVAALTTTQAAGSQFVGWSGACTGTGPCNVTMDAAKSVTATFAATTPPPPPPTTCDDKIKDLEKKVAADQHPWRHEHQLKAALRLYAADLIELPKAKAKVGASDKRYVRAWKEFTDGKAALCGGRYWHAHHDLWDAYYIAHEILKQHRR